MATSGSIDYRVTAENLIRDALYDCGALEEGEPITGEHTQSGLRQLNGLIKHLVSKGLHRWTKEEGILFLDGKRRSYSLPSAQCALTEFGYTTLDADEASGQTVLSVTATAPGSPLPDMAVSDTIGIELDDGTRQWTTIASISAGVSVTIDDALTGDASSGNTVFWYTTNVDRPVRILDARRGTYSGIQVPCEVVRYQTYQSQPNKDATSQPTMIAYNPGVGSGDLYVWPKGGINNVVWFTFERSIEDIDSTANTLDFPQEWYQPLQDMLAARLGPQYQVPMGRQQYLEQRSALALDEILTWDAEPAPIEFTR